VSAPSVAERQLHEAWTFREVVVAKLYRYVRNMSDAEELAQDVMLRYWNVSIEGKVKVASPRGFCLKIAANVAQDFLRRQKVVPIDLVADMEALELLDEAAQAEDIINAHQELEILAAAMKQLSPKTRHVVTLRKVYGLSQKEIAAYFNISENTVEQHLVKGVRALLNNFLA
jgi:RNA polymerase sigma factor (sigma-70 family)